MGNQLALPQKPPSEHLTELPNVVLKDSLGGGRFLKTLLCVHDEGGLVVVKVYYKRGESPHLEPYRKQLMHIRNTLVGIDCPHVWPFQAFVETSSAGYMIRQHMFANLYDRLSTRPFLSKIEKRWITFQLLHALAQCHERGICHGDVKCENILVTSWNWVFLVDFACYKPTHLPADNPADFSFFFDTGGRRRCYIAPERFYQGSSAGINPQAPLQPAMDIFSAGCCLAELHMDGKAFFELSHLLEYRRGEYDPRPMLASVDPDIQDLILHMIQLDPARRWAARDYLTSWPKTVFPPYFEDPLHTFFNDTLRLDTDARVAALQHSFPALQARIVQAGPQGPHAHQAEGSERPPTPPSPSFADLTRSPATAFQPASGEEDTDIRAGAALLADVGGLLGQTDELVQRLDRLSSAEGAGPSGGAGGVIGWEAPRASGPGWRRVDGGLVEERVVEELWEYEVWDGESDEWIATSEREDRGPAAAPMPPGDVPLPAGAGWEWAEEWWVDQHSAECDGEGWQYRQSSHEGDLRGQWTPVSSDGSSLRRRRWVRQRTRHVPEPLQPLPSTVAAELEAAGRAGTPGQEGEARGGGDVAQGGMVLLAVLLCTLLRGSKLMESKRCAVALLYEVAMLCDDDARLQCVIPNLLTLVAEGPVAVRALALRSLVKLMVSLRALPLGDAKVYHDYLLPSLSLLPHDAEEAIRVEYAIGITHLAAASHHHLLKLQRDAQEQAMAHHTSPPLRYNADMAAMRATVEKEVTDLLTGAHNTAEVQRALLSHIWLLFSSLCRGETMLLPLLLTTMNSGGWQVRSAFFRAVASIAALTGQRSLDLFVSPIFEQGLGDPEPSVVAEAVRCVAGVTQNVSKRFLLEAARKAAGLLRHHSAAVRLAGVSCIVAAAKMLHPADVYTQLMTLFDGLLAHEPLLLTDEAAVAAALPPPHPSHDAPPPGRSSSRQFNMPPPPSSPSPTPRSGMSSRGSPERRVSPGPHATPAPLPLLDSAPADPEMLIHPAAPVYNIEVDPSHLTSTCSLHTAAVAGIGARVALLEQRVAALKMRVLPAGPTADPAERQTLEKLLTTVARLQVPPDSDVRDAATRNTFKLTQLALRVVPHPADLQSAAAARINYNLLQPFNDSTQGLGVSDAMAAALSTGISQAASSTGTLDMSNATATWQPRGVLVAHLFEHRAAVNKLAVARSGAFFASASNDSTVKVWDLRRLEKDVSFQSRLTYAAQAGRILAVAPAEGDQSIASASSSGSIHLWRVEYTTRARGVPDKYTGIVGQRTIEAQEGAVLELVPWGGLLLYATQRGGVHAWDPRCREDAWVMQGAARHGLMEHLVVDPLGGNWLLTGSTMGFMSLWDVRFQLQVNSWQHPLALPITAMAPAVAEPRNLGLPSYPRGQAPAFPPGPLVYIAAGPSEVALWEAASGTCRQVLRVVGKEELASASGGAGSGMQTPAALQQRPLSRGPGSLTTAGSLPAAPAAVPQPKPKAFRALLPSPLGPLLTAGGDRCIRYWDAGLPKRSYMVAGPIWPDSICEAPGGERVAMTRHSYQYLDRELEGVAVVEEYAVLERPGLDERVDAVPEMRQHIKMDEVCHADCITHMVAAEANSPMLLTCSRDGCIKAWK